MLKNLKDQFVRYPDGGVPDPDPHRSLLLRQPGARPGAGPQGGGGEHPDQLHALPTQVQQSCHVMEMD